MKTKSFKKKQSKGFSLLEVLIAISIMAIASSSILLSQRGSLNTAEKTKNLNIAVMLAKNLMTESEVCLLYTSRCV